MRCDLRQWDQALRLAETLQPTHIPHICLQYADKLAAEGEYEQALERCRLALCLFFYLGKGPALLGA